MRSSPRRKIRHLPSQDDVSDMSSSYGENPVGIFRPSPPPSFDEDESLLLHRAVGSVMNRAMGNRPLDTKFDTDAMTTEEELIRRSTAVRAKSSSDDFEASEYLSRNNLDYDHPVPSILTSSEESVYDLHPKKPKANRVNETYLVENSNAGGRSIRNERSTESQSDSLSYRRYCLIGFLVFMILCTIGGIAGLVILLIKGRASGDGTDTITLEDQVHVSYTFGPSVQPFRRPSPSPSLRPSNHPSADPKFTPPTYPPTHFPSEIPTGLILPPTSPPTPYATSGPMTISPTKLRTLREIILLQSPETANAWSDPKSPQSLSLLDVSSGPAHDLEKFALLTLAYATNISAWDKATSPCSWSGVSCGLDGSVHKLELRFVRDLVGTLPRELGLATNLKVISIAGSGGPDVKSEISGKIPDLWGKLLTNLRTLELYDNKLSGTIPGTFFQHVTLEYLHLDGNVLTGRLPSTLTGMKNLKSFDLSNNNLVGVLPGDWNGLTHLLYFSAKGCQLVGKIPSDLSSLTKLQELHLKGNKFRGTLPGELRRLTNLGWLSMSENELTGTIPAAWNQMLQLEGLELASNLLRGTLPSNIGTMTNLRILDVSGNFLSGSIPQKWDDLTQLVALSLYQNQIHGQVSSALCHTAMHIESDCNSGMDCSCCMNCFL